MKKCSKCQDQCPDEAKFCSYCGTKFSQMCFVFVRAQGSFFVIESNSFSSFELLVAMYEREMEKFYWSFIIKCDEDQLKNKGVFTPEKVWIVIPGEGIKERVTGPIRII